MPTFIAFNLGDFHQQDNAATRVRVRFLRAKSLIQAKEFMSHDLHAPWVIVDKKTFDKGIALFKGIEEPDTPDKEQVEPCKL